jgi:hypothetical protein
VSKNETWRRRQRRLMLRSIVHAPAPVKLLKDERQILSLNAGPLSSM